MFCHGAPTLEHQHFGKNVSQLVLVSEIDAVIGVDVSLLYFWCPWLNEVLSEVLRKRFGRCMFWHFYRYNQLACLNLLGIVLAFSQVMYEKNIIPIYNFCLYIYDTFLTTVEIPTGLVSNG